jgi:hypothetical protein
MSSMADHHEADDTYFSVDRINDPQAANADVQNRSDNTNHRLSIGSRHHGVKRMTSAYAAGWRHE